ncbi:tryptophan-rich sensory protein [Panacibacter sp. DH6]|uniref:Tryptophan-rich sensory protein n=1 Tax=Panacibacter microcysteis TaxID=2793269 RepID=A0A931E9E0_9BACT|nr:TspO/MBR family protein [Panacibacter microcysteis]MBG9377766.1 tryptophan-rich sensory protein [Panacibacter microcysteis]
MDQSYSKSLNPNLKLFLSLAITLLVGFGAGFATSSAIGTWYAGLNKPFFNPPNWLFAPVWTILYILMGISCYFVWKQPETSKRNVALFVFAVQLALNGMWSIIFFNFHQVGWALVDIVLLWVMILITMYLFSQHSKVAVWLLYPYFFWVSFASVLNGAILYLN